MHVAVSDNHPVCSSTEAILFGLWLLPSLWRVQFIPTDGTRTLTATAKGRAKDNPPLVMTPAGEENKNNWRTMASIFLTVLLCIDVIIPFCNLDFASHAECINGAE